MIDIIKKDWRAKIASLYFIAVTIWWFIGPFFKKAPDERFLGDPGSIYFLIAIWGALWGFSIYRKWGGFKSVMGKAILFFSLGLTGQIFGQIAYGYFPFVLHQPAPYPSIGDIGYFGSIPLYIYGVLLLAKASGVRVGLGSFEKKLQGVLIPVIILIIGYSLFLQEYIFDWSQPIKVFLDFGYPLGQAIYVSLAILVYLLSRGILGGIMKKAILFILFALCFQFLADYTFLYQSSKGIWHVGEINDYMYLVAYFVMTLALLQFNIVLKRLREKK